MTTGPHQARLRRLGVALLTIFALAPALGLLAGPGATASAAETGTAAYDHSIHASDCALLGREYVAGRGCSRTKCMPGAVPWRTTYGAEACTLPGADKKLGYAATVDYRTCKAVNRRWIPQVNYCASDPDRSPRVVFYAPQCVGSAIVYVPLNETDGYFDECLTEARYNEFVVLAAAEGMTIAEEVASRSAAQCADRPGGSYVNGVCVRDPAARPSDGGTVMIGDSITWRGTDELGKLRPTFVLDGEPARPATELPARLAAFRALHGEPDGVIIELGTVPAKTFGRQDLVKAVSSLPASTKVMLVLPYYELNAQPLRVTDQSRRIDGWMRGLARSRDRTCTADWPAYVHAHRGILQDGVHTKHAAEGKWAHWVSQQWGRC